jgi:hypothetical protein
MKYGRFKDATAAYEQGNRNAETLCKLYEAYTAKHNLPHIDAMELCLFGNLGEQHRRWLSRFSQLWDDWVDGYLNTVQKPYLRVKRSR